MSPYIQASYDDHSDKLYPFLDSNFAPPQQCYKVCTEVGELHGTVGLRNKVNSRYYVTLINFCHFIN